MSDVHEDNITMSELDQEPKTLEDYEILVKQLRQGIKLRDVGWKSQLDESTQENAGLSTRVTELTTSVSNAEGRIRELEDQQKKQHVELLARNQEVADLQKAAEETFETLSNRQQEYNHLKQQHDELKSRAEQVENSYNSTSDELKKVQADLKETQENLTALHIQHESMRTSSNNKLKEQAIANRNNLQTKQTADQELAVLRPRVQEQRQRLERLEKENRQRQELEGRLQTRIRNLSGDEASLHSKLAEAAEEQERLRGEVHIHQESLSEMRANMTTCQNGLAYIVNEVRNALVRTALKREPARVSLIAFFNYHVPQSTIRVLEEYEDLPKALSWSLHDTPSGVLTSIPSQTFEHLSSTLRFILFTAPDSAMCAAVIECIMAKINLDEADETSLRNLIAARLCPSHHLTVEYDEIGVLIDLWLSKLPGGADNDFLLQAYRTWFSAFMNTGITQTESLMDIVSGLTLAPELYEVLPVGSVAHPRYLVVLGVTCLLIDVQGTTIHMLQLESMRYDSAKRIISFGISHGGSGTLAGQQFSDFYIGFSRDNSDFIWDNLRALLE
ncbi:hypothetical protein KCU95_g16808, partial [Aureobasidium melanogenum]